MNDECVKEPALNQSVLFLLREDIRMEYEQHHIRSGTSPYINIIVNGKEHQYHNVSITNIPKYP